MNDLARIIRLLRLGCLALAAVAPVFLVLGLVLAKPALWQPAAAILPAALAIGIGALPALAGYQFTVWILAAVTVGMIYPDGVLHWGDFDLRNKWAVLVVVQTVMFGMGAQMSLRDFAGVLKMPWGVLVAVFSQFTVMPLVGFSLTKIFSLPPEIAAGVILIGSCSSGLASNVMCYIARANLALSITATAVTTMFAPLMTPLWMKLLAGALVEVSFVNMMVDIIKIVIVPIGATLLHDYLRFASPRARQVVHVVAVAGAVWAATLLLGWSWFASRLGGTALTWIHLSGFLLGAATAGTLYHRLVSLLPRIDRLMPLLSMAGIMYFTVVSTAAGRDNLLQVGGFLFLVAICHNAAGYGLGYALGMAGGLDRNSARTVAIEVGLQNGGMASGLAGAMGKLATMGLAPAVFSAWMNVSGSILANYWHKRPPK